MRNDYINIYQADILDKLAKLRAEAKKETQSEKPDTNRIAKIKMEEMLQTMKMPNIYGGKSSIRPW